jgi:mycoredoxin
LPENSQHETAHPVSKFEISLIDLSYKFKYEQKQAHPFTNHNGLKREMKMLKVYAAKWCPHCVRTVEYLNQNHIDFEYIDIEKQPKDVVDKIVEVNGGVDWVVPTLEFNGQWREGKVFNEQELAADLKKMNVAFS